MIDDAGLILIKLQKNDRVFRCFFLQVTLELETQVNLTVSGRSTHPQGFSSGLRGNPHTATPND